MQIHGVIFLVDSGSTDRLDEAKEVFSAIAQHEKIKGKPLLIFANKQDLEDAADDDTVAQHLDLDALLGDNRENSSVVRRIKIAVKVFFTFINPGLVLSVLRLSLFNLQVKCVALKSATQNRADPSIKRGVKWLLNSIGKQYDTVADRVRADVMEQRQIEAEQRRERAEKVRRIREERERYQL